MGLCIYDRVVGRVALPRDTPPTPKDNQNKIKQKRKNKMKNKRKKKKNKIGAGHIK